VTAVVPKGSITNASNVAQYVMPYTEVQQGAGKNLANLKWPTPVKGVMQVTLRCDNPL
jgi:hypothetical protein